MKCLDAADFAQWMSHTGRDQSAEETEAFAKSFLESLTELWGEMDKANLLPVMDRVARLYCLELGVDKGLVAMYLAGVTIGCAYMMAGYIDPGTDKVQ